MTHSFGRGIIVLRRTGWLPIALCAAILLQPWAAGQLSAPPGLGGRVTDAVTGAPIARVLVQTSEAAVFTDHEGKFQLAGSVSVNSVQLTKPGFSTSPEQAESANVALPGSADPSRLELTLWPEAVLSGTVTGPEGEGLIHLNVTARRMLFENGTGRWLAAGSAVTDSHGNFRMVVPAGDYVLGTHFAAPGPGRVDAVLPAETPTGGSGALHLVSGSELHVDLHPHLSPAFHVTVPFEGLPERQVPNISLQIASGVVYRPGGMRLVPGGVAMDLPAGSYRLSARINTPEGLRFGEGLLNVPDRDATVAAIRLEPVPLIAVEISLDPADASTVALPGRLPTVLPNVAALNLQLQPSGLQGRQMMDESVGVTNRVGGQFGFAAPAGSYRLQRGGGSPWIVTAATMGGTDLLHDDLAVGTNGGAEPIHIVVSQRSGTINASARIRGEGKQAWVVLMGDGASLPRFRMQRTDAAGLTSVAGLAPGNYLALALPFFHSADFADPAVVKSFKNYLSSVTLEAGATASLALETVPTAELLR